MGLRLSALTYDLGGKAALPYMGSAAHTFPDREDDTGFYRLT
ncbi:MAG TPA: hypothetical protein VMT62_15595 [Syntrophorhabdaceae bacterium]|nr:hypothetical protein [Syntrophorhabdaceae bacterium]